MMELSRDLFQSALLVALPALLTALVIGLVVSFLQAITSIQDQALGHVPRLLAVGLVLILTMGFTLQVAVAFTQRTIQQASKVGM
jgi:flagellar biosynthetic protein FliQ